MAESKDISRTLGDAQLGHLGDMEDGDFTKGFYDAAPEGNYEGSLSDEMATIVPGNTESDAFRRTHGRYGEYGYLKRGPFERT